MVKEGIEEVILCIKELMEKRGGLNRRKVVIGNGIGMHDWDNRTRFEKG